jgi:hypothetical protein
MSEQLKTLEEIHAALKILRGKPGSRRRFPKQIWDSILELAKIHPHQEICQQLEIHPGYLKRKIQKSQSSSKSLDFQEVFCEPRGEAVVIELTSKSGLKAKIQGSSSCLSYLSSLFGGK